MAEFDTSKIITGSQSTNDYINKISTTDFYNGGSTDVDRVTYTKGQTHTFEFAKWHHYYEEVPILAAIIDTLASWAVGKGFKTDKKTKEILNKIKGYGKDDFNTIIENLLKVCLNCGDSLGEIIKDKAGRLTNLKPLNPGTMQVRLNESGIIQDYIQNANEKSPFKPKQIFHLSWNRFADEIHGKALAGRAEPNIKILKQLQEDLGVRFHRLVVPQRMYTTNTDDETKNQEIENKLITAWKGADLIVVPEGFKEMDAAKQMSADDCISFINTIIRNLVSSCNVPEVVLGWSQGSTEATSKIIYLAFQQKIERIQLFLEEQIRLQLGIEINFEFPASLDPVKVSNPESSKKDGNKKAARPGDLKA